MRLYTLKNIFHGFLLSFQFFTSIPIRKNLSMNEKSVTMMYAFLPIVSLLMGLTTAFIVLLNDYYFSFTPLFLVIIVVVLHIVMTGGLHLDGFIDVGDAYFSYRDQKRRLEILSDSRVGAFGAICLVVYLLLKVGVFYELFTKNPNELLIYFLFIPAISRLGMLFYFNVTKTAKEEGLAAYFKKQVIPKTLSIFIVIYIIVIGISSVLLKNYLFILLVFCAFFIVLLYRKWTKHHFGGMTGDLLGAFYEGVELILWIIVLWYIS